MDSEAATQSKPPKDEASSTEGRRCQKGSCENRAPELPERRSRLFVQYEEGNPSVYTDFGATLLTDNQSHRLVDVSPMGVAHRIGLCHNDEIFFFNGVNVEDVIHDSLVDGIRDMGPRLLFGGIRISNQEQSSLVKKGYVYVRLGADANNVPEIQFHMEELSEVEDKEMKVETFILPDEESFQEISNVYELAGSANIELNLASTMYLDILSNGAYFVRRDSTLCMYTYRPAKLDTTGTIVAMTTDINDTRSSSQYCISGGTAGILNTEFFPDYMKTIYNPPLFFLPNEKLFRWVVHGKGQQSITALADTDLKLDSRGPPTHQAILEYHMSFVTIDNKGDCTRNCCTINPPSADVKCSNN